MVLQKESKNTIDVSVLMKMEAKKRLVFRIRKKHSEKSWKRYEESEPDKFVTHKAYRGQDSQ